MIPTKPPTGVHIGYGHGRSFALDNSNRLHLVQHHDDGNPVRQSAVLMTEGPCTVADIKMMIYCLERLMVHAE